MVKINKPEYPPEVRYAIGPLKGQLKWRVAYRALMADFVNNPAPFNNGKYPFSADFGKVEYRAELKKCQGNKCCFCEKPVAKSDIEHFRPKRAYQQAKGGALLRPGYYWLAYSWSNMLIACTDCNSKACKGNVFPVAGPRSTSPSDCRAENKSIINPTEEDPSIYITFRHDVPHGHDANGRGDENIVLFNLKHRADLVESRRDRLGNYKAMKKIATANLHGGINTAQEIAEAKIFINKAVSSKSHFAGMIRENVKHGLI